MKHFLLFIFTSFMTIGIQANENQTEINQQSNVNQINVNNAKTTFKTLEEAIIAAELGDTETQFNLGVMYESGVQVKKNIKEAFRWYKMAAEQGYASAQNNLGAMYYTGKGVLQSYKQAVRWYRQAAMQGNASAQYNLGRLYHLGNGVLKNPNISYAWFSIAKFNGFDLNLDDHLSGVNLLKAQEIAAQCFESDYLNCGL